MASMNNYTPKYFGNAVDINLAKQNGVQGEFFDTSKSNQGALIQTIRNAYDRGHNPVLLGGNKAQGGISGALENRLKSTGYNNISRIGGDNRYDVQNALNRYDTNNKVNYLYDQRKQAQLDQAKTIAPQYQAQRNQADVVNQQNVSKLKEIMAASGLTGSGENITAQVGANAQRQNSLNSINLAEQQARNEINQRAQEIEAQRIQALLESDRYLDDRDYQYSRDKVEDSRYNEQFKYQKQQDAANRYWQTYQFNNLSGSEKVNLNWQKQQYKTEKAWREYQFKNMSATEKAQLEWAKSQYGEDSAWRMFELNYNGELAKSQSQAELDMYKNSGFLMP